MVWVTTRLSLLPLWYARARNPPHPRPTPAARVSPDHPTPPALLIIPHRPRRSYSHTVSRLERLSYRTPLRQHLPPSRFVGCFSPYTTSSRLSSLTLTKTSVLRTPRLQQLRIRVGLSRLEREIRPHGINGPQTCGGEHSRSSGAQFRARFIFRRHLVPCEARNHRRR